MTEANEVVRPIHEKAMPVLMTTPAKWDAWLSAEPAEALKLQRPLQVDQLKVVAKGEREYGVTSGSQPPTLLL